MLVRIRQPARTIQGNGKWPTRQESNLCVAGAAPAALSAMQLPTGPPKALQVPRPVLEEERLEWDVDGEAMDWAE